MVLQSLTGALQSKMSKGCGKELLNAVVKFIEYNVAELPKNKIQHLAPSLSTSTNGDVIEVPESQEFHSKDFRNVPPPCSPGSSEYEFGDDSVIVANTRHTLCPDYIIVMDKYPGEFILNFHLNKQTDYNYRLGAAARNTHAATSTCTAMLGRPLPSAIKMSSSSK